MSTITHHGFTHHSSDTPYTHAVASPSGQALLTLLIVADGTFATSTATPSGVWPTWELVESAAVTGGQWMFTWQGRGTPSAGTISIAMGGAGFTEGFFATVWLDLVADANTTDLVVQSDNATDVTDTPLVTLAAFSGGSNATYSVTYSPNRTVAPGSGFTELAETNNALNIGQFMQSQWRNSPDTSVDNSLTSGDDWSIFGFEIAEPSGGGGSAVPVFRYHYSVMKR